MKVDARKLTFAIALLSMLATAGLLNHFRSNQRLGPPAVRTEPSPDTNRLHVVLPERVLDFSSEEKETDKLVLDFLPKDTSFGQREYTSTNGFRTTLNVVLMGTDRTSLHKPQFCLAGAGWDVDYNISREDRIPIERPFHYDLPVMKLIATKRIRHEGRDVLARGLYVYWFVAEDAYTAQHWQRMWWMARDFVRTGVLQRWAYVTCFSACYAGQEEATYARMKKFIAESIPEFQLVPRGDAGTRVATQQN